MSNIDIQVLNWLYEYSVKNGVNDVCTMIESEYKVLDLQPSNPASGFLLCIRSLQIFSRRKYLNPKGIFGLILLLEDLIRYEPLHRCYKFHRGLVNNMIACRLLLIDNQKITRELKEKEFFLSDWTTLKELYGYKDDYFEEYYNKLMKTTRQAIQACLTRDSSEVLVVKEVVTQASLKKGLNQLLIQLTKLLPSGAIEKILANEDLRLDLARQNTPEYDILLKNLEKGISAEAIKTTTQALLDRRHSHNQCNVVSQSSPKPPLLNEMAVDVSQSESDDLEFVQVNNKLWSVKEYVPCERKFIYMGKNKGHSNMLHNVENITQSLDNDIIVNNSRILEIRPTLKISFITFNDRSLPDSCKIFRKKKRYDIEGDAENFEIDAGDTYMQNASVVDSEIQEVEKLINVLENYLSKLKCKLKEKKKKKYIEEQQRKQNLLRRLDNQNRKYRDISHCQKNIRNASVMQQTGSYNAEQSVTHVQSSSVCKGNDMKIYTPKSNTDESRNVVCTTNIPSVATAESCKGNPSASPLHPGQIPSDMSPLILSTSVEESAENKESNPCRSKSPTEIHVAGENRETPSRHAHIDQNSQKESLKSKGNSKLSADDRKNINKLEQSCKLQAVSNSQAEHMDLDSTYNTACSRPEMLHLSQSDSNATVVADSQSDEEVFQTPMKSPRLMLSPQSDSSSSTPDIL